MQNLSHENLIDFSLFYLYISLPFSLFNTPGGYSGFQVTGMIEGFFGGFEIVDSGILLG